MMNNAHHPILSVLLVDYDNVYSSLLRKCENAAGRFAQDAGAWRSEIASGVLTINQGAAPDGIQRRLVTSRCYGNPIPRRMPSNGDVDMNSFGFMRHNFLSAGFEVVDCPPQNAYHSYSSDISMVMDILDLLEHKTLFDEFVIFSNHGDFTPVLHRLRTHNKRIAVFTNDQTQAHYEALSDSAIREDDLIAMLRGQAHALPGTSQGDGYALLRSRVSELVASVVMHADQPVPIEVLAECCMGELGHEKTLDTNWFGAGSFRQLLSSQLSDPIRMTSEAPYLAFDASRIITASAGR